MDDKQLEAELNAAFDSAVTQTLVAGNSDGKTVIQYEQDVEAILAANKKQRDEASTLPGSKFKTKPGGMNFHHAARVPLTVVLDIKMKYGLDMMGYCTPDEMARIYRIIQTEYPYCMTTPHKVFGRSK